jgi:hypothetical protein
VISVNQPKVSNIDPVFKCMVPSCKWLTKNKQLFFSHSDEHICGKLQGNLPPEFFSIHKRVICKSCGNGSVYSGSKTQRHKTCNASPKGNPQPPSIAPVPPVPSAPSAVPLASPDSSDPPSIEDVFSTYIPTIRYVPKPLQADFASLLNRALSDAIFYNTSYYWNIFLILPK